MFRTFSTFKAVSLGAALGLVFAMTPSCGTKPPATRCNASNCDGCCSDVDGTCFRGVSNENCGAAGASCTVCMTGTCQKISATSEFGGRCVSGNGGGDGGTGGGTANDGGTGGGTSGGGSTTGGGTAAGGGTGSDGGVCNATTCPNGCCTSSGTCQTTTTAARCGRGGQLCQVCTQGNTCVTGACTPCNGCVDISTGTCKSGTVDAECGKTGAFCQRCDTTTGQSCQAGLCQGGANCNASTCPTGCCDGNNCVQPGSWSNAQCGAGAGGAACTACRGSQVCDAADAGMCTGGSSGSDGGIFPDLDGGIPGFCDAQNPCPVGECCGALVPICFAAGDNPTGFVELCGSQTTCVQCTPVIGTCNTTTYTCQ